MMGDEGTLTSLLTILLTVASLFFGDGWVVNGGGNWTAFSLWTAIAFLTGVLVCWLMHGNRWKRRACKYEAVKE